MDFSLDALEYHRLKDLVGRYVFTDAGRAELEIPEIEAIQSFLSHVEGLRVRWKEEREKFPKLARTGQRIPDLGQLSKNLKRAIQNGEVDDRYSPELARIRRVLSATRSRLTERLESIVRSPAYS